MHFDSGTGSFKQDGKRRQFPFRPERQGRETASVKLTFIAEARQTNQSERALHGHGEKKAEV